MLTNRRKFILAGVALLVALVGMWFALVHTEQLESVKLPVPLSPVRSAQPWPHELPEPMLEEPPETTPTNAPPANVADIYRKAFALIDALSPDERNTVGDWKAEVDPAVAAALC